MQSGNRLRVALQKSGKLANGSIELLQKCGIQIMPGKNQLFVQDDNYGVDLIFARDDDILGFLDSGVCDLGIIGRNLIEEYIDPQAKRSPDIEVLMPLDFSKCRLSIAVPMAGEYKNLSDLEGKCIATSYPNILKKFLTEKNIDAKVVTMHGSVELAPKIGIADLICDLVSSGATLKENGLKELVKVMESEAVLVVNNTCLQKQEKLLNRLMLRLRGVLSASQNKYIMLHIERRQLALLSDMLPGSEAPTVLELKGMPSKVAVHLVSPEDVFWETIEKLKAIGASSILVLQIEKMVK